VLNEQEVIPLFVKRVEPLVRALGYTYELVFVDDGSTDATPAVLTGLAEADPAVKVIEFSRNFGKEFALCAGFEYARGDAVIPMDVDLQDPPELLAEFVRLWENGADVVVGVRSSRASDSLAKRLSAKLFYKCFRLLCGDRMLANAGDYRLLSRPAVDALNAMPERVRFTKGLYAWIGFSQAVVPYERPPRLAGTSKWNSWKLWNFALDGITSFTSLPLRVWSYMGLFTAFLGFGYATLLIIRTLVLGIDVPGYASIMVVLLTLGGFLLTSLGIVGEYLGRIFEEVKMRPRYIVRRSIGLEEKRKEDQQSRTVRII
jgi:glycosyltransferase involved in cell wall biosynthesis